MPSRGSGPSLSTIMTCGLSALTSRDAPSATPARSDPATTGTARKQITERIAYSDSGLEPGRRCTTTDATRHTVYGARTPADFPPRSRTSSSFSQSPAALGAVRAAPQRQPAPAPVKNRRSPAGSSIKASLLSGKHRPRYRQGLLDLLAGDVQVGDGAHGARAQRAHADAALEQAPDGGRGGQIAEQVEDDYVGLDGGGIERD